MRRNTGKRKMLDRDSPQLKSRSSSEPSPTRVKTESVGAKLEEGKILLRQAKGVPATFNAYSCWVLEPRRNIFYIVGGSTRPGSDDASDDFYANHLLGNCWHQHTNIVRFDPCGKNPFRTRPTKRLPPILNAASDIFYNGKQTFLILFGGLKADETLSGDFISIDVDQKQPVWSKFNIAGGVIAPREMASMTILQKKMYIFGGLLEDEFTHTPTFSVAEYREPAGWNWVVRDQCYPQQVKELPWLRLNSHPTPDGHKIILTAEVEHADHQIGTNGPKLILFDVKQHTFEPMVNSRGSFPHTEIGFDVQTLPAPTRHSPAYSILIAGFQNRLTKYCFPELWKCQLDHEQKCDRLPISDVLAGLDLCLQVVVTSGNHCYVLGTAPDKDDVNVSLKMSLEAMLLGGEHVVDHE